MQAGASLPRPEYPRPERQRGRAEGFDWLNLNGPWQFRFDPQNSGILEKWWSVGGPDWREQIVVPFCWESLAAWGEGETAGNEHYYSTRVFLDPSAVTRKNHRIAPRYEIGWYRRTVRIPQNGPWEKKRVILTIGAADFFTDAWCNGVHLGHHEGGYEPFEFDLTDALRSPDQSQCEAIIVLRVEDPMDNHDQPVGKQWGWYTPTSGIWQTVFIEPRSATHLQSYRVFTDIDAGTARFEARSVGVGHSDSLTVEITAPTGENYSLTLIGSGASASGEILLSPLTLWDPDDPQLYMTRMRITRADGALVDEVRGYFGMRKISSGPAPGTEGPTMIRLNNEPIYLRGALYQSYHPDGVYTAGDVATLKADLAFAKNAGFDFLRIHLKLDDPLVLHYADTVGILIMQDLPNFGEGGDTAMGRRRFESLMRAGLERDFNHPSLIAWCLFNESWGFGGQSELIKWIAPQSQEPGASPISAVAEKLANQGSFKWIHEMWLLAKTLDPTRLIEDMSVVRWDHLSAYGHVDTDINSWHFYIDDYERARVHIEEVVEKTFPGSAFNYVEGHAQRDVPLINSEYGGVGALDGDRDISWSFKFLTNELRRHGKLSAYIFTELTDVEWETNGFLNYDRTPKDFGYAPTLVNQGDVLPISAAPILRCLPSDTLDVEILSSHFSRRPREGVRLHWQYDGLDTLGTAHPVLQRGSLPIPFPHHRVVVAARIALTLPVQPMLCTLTVTAVASDGFVIARNFVQHFSCAQPPLEREDLGRSLVLRRRVGDLHQAEWSGGSSTGTDASVTGSCCGRGSGFLEWRFSDAALGRLSRARRVRSLLELSARKEDVSQTDRQAHPTHVQIFLNDLLVHQSLLPDHPHDSRGALSYLRGERGAYGYLLRSTVENGQLQALAAATRDGVVRLRCAVTQFPLGGLTVYDYDCGRFPVGPTLVVEWE